MGKLWDAMVKKGRELTQPRHGGHTAPEIHAAMDIYLAEKKMEGDEHALNHDSQEYIAARDDNIIAVLLREVQGCFVMNQPARLGVRHSGIPAHWRRYMYTSGPHWGRFMNAILNSDVYVSWDDADKGYKVTKDRWSNQPLPSRCLTPKEYATLVAHCVLIDG